MCGYEYIIVIVMYSVSLADMLMMFQKEGYSTLDNTVVSKK